MGFGDAACLFDYQFFCCIFDRICPSKLNSNAVGTCRRGDDVSALLHEPGRDGMKHWNTIRRNTRTGYYETPGREDMEH